MGELAVEEMGWGFTVPLVSTPIILVFGVVDASQRHIEAFLCV